MIAFCIFSDNLSLQNKEMRLSTLRVLSHYDRLDPPMLTSEEPHLKNWKQMKLNLAENYLKIPAYAFSSLLWCYHTNKMDRGTIGKGLNR